MEKLIQIQYHLDELRTLVVQLSNFDPRIPLIKADIIEAFNAMREVTTAIYAP